MFSLFPLQCKHIVCHLNAVMERRMTFARKRLQSRCRGLSSRAPELHSSPSPRCYQIFINRGKLSRTLKNWDIRVTGTLRCTAGRRELHNNKIKIEMAVMNNWQRYFAKFLKSSDFVDNRPNKLQV